MALCPVCQGSIDSAREFDGGERIEIQCDGCGNFVIAKTAVLDLASQAGKRGLVSHWLRLAWLRGEKPELDKASLGKVLAENFIPTVSQQADAAIAWLGDTLLLMGKPHGRIKLDRHQRALTASIGAHPEPEGGLMYILKPLVEKGFIYPSSLSQYSESIGLTFDGWERYHAIKRRNTRELNYGPRELPVALDFLNSDQRLPVITRATSDSDRYGLPRNITPLSRTVT